MVALLAMLPACAVNNTGIPLPGTGDGGSTADLPSVFSRLPDGALVLPDARYLADGAVVLSDGAVITNGTVIYADGAVVALDGALVTTDVPRVGVDGSTPTSDGSVTNPTGDGGVTKTSDVPTADVDPMTGCGDREICNNGRDDNCNGRVDESCPCIPGMSVPCYPGNPIQAGVGACGLGTSTCEGTGEFGTWSACRGAGMPGTETCGNDLDDDCDGMADEGCACRPGMTRMCYTGPDGTAGRGVCRAGTETCAADGSGWGMCTGQVLPTSDTCDGMDRDCDGNNYTGCGCMVGMTRSCYSGPTGTAGRGLCRAGMQTCVASTGMGSMWGACTGEVLPGRDTCDGMDRDCDGNAATGCVCTIGARRACYTGPTGTQGVGICRPGTQTCTASGTGSIWAVCTGDTLPRTEICANGMDDNCNGMTDEGCTVTPMCTPGTVMCGTRCVDTMTSTTDCGACGHACAPTEACVMGVCVGNGMLRFTMTWDRMGDMDLHIVPPCSTEIYYARLSACGGTLDHDSCPANRAGYTGDSCLGPENTFWASAPAAGTYIVCANPYLTTTPVNFTIQVYRGATLVRTFTGTRAASPSSAYRACTRGGPTYVGDFVL